MKTNYRQLIKARNDYIEENDWWQENKHYHIGEYFENIERINVKEAAKAYKIQLKKLKKNVYYRRALQWRKSLRLPFVYEEYLSLEAEGYRYCIRKSQS